MTMMSIDGGGSGSSGLSILIPAISVGSLAAVALWEIWRRRRKRKFPAAKRRAGNISFWLFNTTVAALVFTPPDQIRSPWSLTPLPSLVAGFLLLDLMIYAVHRTYHAVPLLWRLHALHHSDPDVDWSTAVRHHPIEYVSAGAVYWLAILAIGIPGPVVAFHALCVFVAAVATHGNVHWPAWLERALQPIVITLDAHLVHHSADAAEANANFGAVLSMWDRVFGTYRRPSHEPVFGVRELAPRDACKPTEMLLTPFRIGKMYTNTHRLPDGREIEVSADRRGNTLRLRANLVNVGVIEAAHSRDYAFDPDTTAYNIAEFTAEFETIAGIEMSWPLFPADLFGAPQAKLPAVG
jgi:sterol desaturase/sphingolipid hydroxylase (fatty acid hydroxylase superfamily)